MAKRGRRGSDDKESRARRDTIVEDVPLAEATRIALPQLCPERHHLAGLARRPRRPQAGAAADLVRDVGRPPRHGRRPLHEVRGGRRRGDEELSPARRPVDLRRPGPDGPAVQPAASAGRGLRQLRLDRRRPAGRDAVHRVPADADRRRSCSASSATRRSTSGRITPRRPRSRWSSPRSSPTCWSTGRRGSPSGWRRTSRRTTSRKSARRSIALLDNRELPLEKLSRYIQGPDFPTGGVILNTPDEIRQIYATGPGVDQAPRHLRARPREAEHRPDHVDPLRDREGRPGRADRRADRQGAGPATDERQGPEHRRRPDRPRAPARGRTPTRRWPTCSRTRRSRPTSTST